VARRCRDGAEFGVCDAQRAQVAAGEVELTYRYPILDNILPMSY
jgi:hypothetical protein